MRHLASTVTPCCRAHHGVRYVSSIFDVIRQRRLESSEDVAPTPSNDHSVRIQVKKDAKGATRKSPVDKGATKGATCDTSLITADQKASTLDTHDHIKQIWKQFSILRSKPSGYRDTRQLRYLTVRTLELLPITSSEEICNIAEVVSHLKYRNIILLQGLSEALFWHCKLGKCSLRDITRFLRVCATLRYIPSFRHITQFLSQLDNVEHRPSVGDYLRILQFLVGNNIHFGDVFEGVYSRCLRYCMDNMGYMTHQHLGSLSQTQLLIDPSDSFTFNRICLNFGRNLTGEEFPHFLMLSNSIVRSELKELSLHYPPLLHSFIGIADDWTPTLINTVLGILDKFYYRDMVALSKLGHIIIKHMGRFKPLELQIALNHYSKLCYKHKELIRAVMQSPLSESTDAHSRLQVLSAVANMLAKVDYKPIEVIKNISDRTMGSLVKIRGELSQVGTCASIPMDQEQPNNGIPWVVYEKRYAQSVHTCYPGNTQNPVAIVTGSMVLDMIAPPVGSNNTVVNHVRKSRSGARRLLWRSKDNVSCPPSISANLEQLKVTPTSVDILRSQSLKEYLDEFINTYFDGRHPASKRLDIRRQMRYQTERFTRVKSFEPSRTLDHVRLERSNQSRLNISFRKVKRIMRYSGSRHVQTTRYYINECRVLKRCFLRPYKELVHTSAFRETHTTNTVHDQLFNIWKQFSRWCLSQPSTMSVTTVDLTLAEQSPLDFGTKNILEPPKGMTIPISVPSHHKVISQLECYVDARTPIFLDNALLLRPIKVSSLYSWRLKRKLESLEKSHEHNPMVATVSYMMENGFWKEWQPLRLCYVPREQPLWRYISSIVASLHKLNFVSFGLIKEVCNILEFSKIKVTSTTLHGLDCTAKDIYRPLLKTMNHFGHLVSATTTIMSRDTSGSLSSQFLDVLCKSGIFDVIALNATKTPPPIQDITQLLHRFNMLLFYSHIRPAMSKLGHNRALHTLEVEKALRSLGFMGVDICTNKELFESLQKVKRIEFDIVRKRLLYKNPYESVTSAESLVEFIIKNHSVQGLRINEELLNTNPKMVEWINDLLKHRKLRAVRSTSSNVKGKHKCRYAGKPNQCTLYSSSKCGECSNNLRDVLLFPLGKENYEHDRLKLDQDIKELWDSVAIPPLDQLLGEYNISQIEHSYVPPQSSRRRRGEAKQNNSGVKMRRIYNTHLFTAQELSADIGKSLRK
ncbi:hypothetical protein BaOVIS_028350 [Babesia ovis]|uniref:Uncharacterized protein n=1 Tax=Babesia ovis TaxID=5869 RepID=A0A9W5TDJ0_BABOV|nr:hypothetical protein BaOVIS_028350 [Babesia ovis]